MPSLVGNLPASEEWSTETAASVHGVVRRVRTDRSTVVDQSLENVADGELVAAVLAGGRGEFVELVRRYQSPLLRVARSRLGDAQRAEDVVQETFLNAHRWLKTYDSKQSFRTWLWTILLNQCSRNHAKQSRTPIVHSWSNRPADAVGDRTFAHPQCEAPSPESQLLAKERAELLEQSLWQLPQSEADALRLRFYGQLKFREIADAMHCSLSTAKNRVRGGLVKLAEIVTDTEALAEADEAVASSDKAADDKK